MTHLKIQLRHLYCSANAVMWLKEGGKDMGDCQLPKDSISLGWYFSFSVETVWVDSV